MLVILSGPDSIPKTDFARRIYSAFVPDFEFAGYTVSYKHYPFAVYNANKEPVYLSEGTDNVTSLLFEPNGKIIFSDITDIQLELMLDTVRVNDFRTIFVDLQYDIGITFNVDTEKYTWMHQPPQLGYPHTFEDVVANYKNRKHDVHVIVGSFARAFIDEIRNELGAQNVTVINMMRDPIVDRLMNFQQDDNFYTGNMSFEEHNKMHNKAIINSAFLTQHDDIVNLKYEQVIKDGYFMVNGTKIELLKDHCAYNNFITNLEKSNFDESIVNEQDLTEFQQFVTNVETFFKDPRVAYLANKPNMNILELTNYSPLTVNQIVAPKE